MHYDRLLIITDQSRINSAGRDRIWMAYRGLYSFQDLEAMERTTKHVSAEPSLWAED